MSTADVELAKQRAEVADVGLEAAKVKQRAAEVRLEAAKKAVELAEVAAEHAKQSLELERLRLEHADCCPEQEGPPSVSSPARKRARLTKATEEPVLPAAEAVPVVAEPAAAAQDAVDPVAAAQKELSAARRELQPAACSLQDLQEVVLQRRKEQQQMAGRLVALRGKHRNCTALRVSVAKEAEWFEKELECSSETLAKEVARKKFVDELSKAPCLGSLSLHLRNLEGKNGLERPLPQSVLQAVAAAPSRIKILQCEELGWDGCEAVFALLQRAKDHLDEFVVSDHSLRALRDKDVRRLWSILVGSNVSELNVAPELLRDVGFVLEAGSWPRLQRVNFEGSICFSDRTTGQLAMLAPLLRANVTNLRAVSLPGPINREMRQAVFEALAACAGLEELNAPCYQELGLLTTCSKLTNLTVHRIDLSKYGEEVDNDIQAVGRFLRAPSTASRLERLHLADYQCLGQRALPVYEAIRDLKKLESLTLELCQGFDDVLGATLKALPCLEELHMLNCDCLYTEVVTEHVTPENAPKLKLLELDTHELYEPQDAKKWRREMWDVEADFRSVNPDFRLVDHIEEQFHGGLSPDSDTGGWF